MPSGIRTRTSGIMVNVAMLPPITVTTNIQNLVSCLTVNGIFAKLDRLWVFAQATEGLALVDLVASATATAVNSPTFTANTGYTGQDLVTPTQYINTGFAPSSGVNFTLNSAHASVWVVGNTASTNGGCVFGTSDGADVNNCQMFDTFTDNGHYVSVNNNGNDNLLTSTTRQGHWLVNRLDSTGFTLYEDGTDVSGFFSKVSGARSTSNFYALCRNDGANPGFGTPNQVAALSFGASLSTTEITNFYNCLRTYMTAVGVP